MSANQSKLYAWSLIVGLAGFLFGFDTVVISGADQSLSNLWSSYTLGGESSAFHGIVVMSSALWGTVLGAALGAFPTDKLGRKKTLFYIGIFYFVSALGSALTSDPYLFAGFLRGQSVEMVKCRSNDLEVPATAEFVLEGFIDGNAVQPISARRPSI